MSSNIARVAVTAAITLGLVGVASAQYVYRGRYGVAGGYYGGYFGGNYASTPAQAYMNGMSQALRGAGEYNQMTAEANIRNQEAKRLELENRKKSTETFFELRKMNRDYVAAEQAAKKAAVVDSGNTVERLAAQRERRELSITQLDPVSGQITWPTVLMDSRYDMYRAPIEQMFINIAAGHAPSTGSVQAAINNLRGFLDKQYSGEITQDYAEAVKFLRLLGGSVHTHAGA
jgi:hypothetical protein